MKRVIIALGVVALSSTAHGQQTDSLSQTHAEFMERAYMYKNFPDSKTAEWFQAYLPLHIPIIQNLQGAYDQVLKNPWQSHQTVSLYFSMMVDLRMTKENSAPVRTPSYMPKFTVTYFNVKRDERRTFPDTLSKTVRMWAIPFVPYGHYSNGQDGCLYTFQQEINKVCTDTSTAPHGLTVNRRDGSFSSHYMQLGVFYRKLTLDPATQAGTYAVASSFWSGGIQVRAYQPYYSLGGGMSPELRDVYGPTRIRGVYQHVSQVRNRWGPGQIRFETFAEWLPGASDLIDPVRVSFEAARTFDKHSGWGVFARLYSGQDDYNLGFLTNIRVFQIGVTGLGERMPAFGY